MSGEDAHSHDAEEDDELLGRACVVVRDAGSYEDVEWEMQKVDGERAFGDEVRGAHEGGGLCEGKLARDEEQE